MNIRNVSKGFNLYVDISTACNASCPFCIAPSVGRKDGSGFFSGLQYALDLTSNVNGSVQIVGGEPLISRRLPNALSMISDYQFRRIVVNTNGTKLAETLPVIVAAGVTHVNVSRHHYDETRNQEIMRLRPAIPNRKFTASICALIESGMNMRMQCNILKGYIDSVPSMLNYINWCADHGCAEISFSQTFPLSLFDYQKPIEIGYAEKMQIDLVALVRELDACGHFVPAPDDYLNEMGMSSWGHSNWCGPDTSIYGKRRFWIGPRGTTISLKTLSGYDSNRLPLPTSYNKADDPELKDGYLAFAVVHPDGKVTASWDSRERVLFSPDRKEQPQYTCVST